MSAPNIPWDELLKNRRVQQSSRNSGMMMDNINRVLEVVPNAQIKHIGGGKWKLFDGSQAISNMHGGHYDCWREAAAAIDESCKQPPPTK